MAMITAARELIDTHCAMRQSQWHVALAFASLAAVCLAWSVLPLQVVAEVHPQDGTGDHERSSESPPPDLTFVHLSDTHLATARENPQPRHRLMPHTKDLVRSPQWLQAAVKRINDEIKPDFVVITGDVIDASGVFPADLERARRILDELDSDYHVLVGNHERPVKDQFMRVFDTTPNFTFTYGRWRFVALDGSRSTLSQDALAHLRDQLANSGEDENIVVMNHFPLTVPPWIHDLARTVYPGALVVENADQALALIDTHPAVRLVLAGHVHHEIDHKRRGVPHLTTGSLIKPPHRFRVFSIRGDEIEWKLYDVRLIEPQPASAP